MLRSSAPNPVLRSSAPNPVLRSSAGHLARAVDLERKLFPDACEKPRLAFASLWEELRSRKCQLVAA